MNDMASPFRSVTYENNCSQEPVTAREIHVQEGNENLTNTEPECQRDDALRFFDGIVPKPTSPYFEDGVLKQGVPGNWACESSAPYIEEILADEQLRTRHTIGRYDPYSPQPAYNPWYKPFAKRAQQPTGVLERPNLVATYQIRSHSSWSRGECLGTFVAIVTFVFLIMALFVYVIMGVSAYLSGRGWNPWFG